MKKQDEPKTEIGNEVTIKSTQDFESALKVFLDKRREAEKRVIALKDGLSKYRVKLSEFDKGVADAVQTFQDTLVDGKPDKARELVSTAKQEQAAMVAIVQDLEASAIPAAEEALRRSQAELLVQFKALLKPLHDEFASKMNEHFKHAGKVWTTWAYYLDKMIPSLNLQGMTWFEKEAFYILTPVRDEDMSRYLELINR